jgi:DNA-binding NarL/FixJ family response regulator
MEWYLILILVFGGLLGAVSIAFVWYLNVGGLYQAIKSAGEAEKALLDKAAKRIKVLVVDDHVLVRDGIRSLLGVHNDMQVVGEAVNGQEAVQKASELSPDVVLMDIRMPVMNGVEATNKITKGGRTKVLMLTQYDEDENVFASRQAGASGFVPKRSAGPDLLEAIRAVNQGKRFMPCIASQAA